ncbi:unnamed protein product [Citrullus colocynthis]|uniref:Uncharacterized protein n=1 Tax=Citrullus colocynthis TaxID=252529 RepID=A0ABP0Z4C9_9ROSI
MEAQNLASDESVSSGPCMDFHLNFNNIQNNHETASANSSNVGLGLLGENGEDGAVHLQQESCHPKSHPNNSPIEELFLLQFPPTNLPYHDDQPAEPKFNRKRARDGGLMHGIVREDSSSQPSIRIKGGIGNCGRMKNQSIAKKKNPSDGRLTNSVYDVTFEEVGLPIDPHLRLFLPL